MRMSRAFALFAAAAILTAPVAADALSDWFDLPCARNYLSARAEIESLRDLLESGGVTSELLVERLREGCAKKVASEKLMAAIREDTERFLYLGKTFSDLPSGIADSAERDPFIRDGAIALRSGITRTDFASCLEGLSPGGLPRRLSAILAAAAVNSRFPLESADTPLLVRALDGSPDRESRFSRLSAVYVRARSGGLSASETTERAIKILSSGGTLFSLESDIDGSLK